MKKLLFSLGMILTISIAYSQQNRMDTSLSKNDSSKLRKIPKPPTIKLDIKEIDFGNMLRGEDGVRMIPFSNHGDQPLVFNQCYAKKQQVIISCPTTQILPNESGQIKIQCDTYRQAEIEDSLIIMTNDPANGNKSIRIMGSVSP